MPVSPPFSPLSPYLCEKRKEERGMREAGIQMEGENEKGVKKESMKAERKKETEGERGWR